MNAANMIFAATMAMARQYGYDLDLVEIPQWDEGEAERWLHQIADEKNTLDLYFTVDGKITPCLR
jgi:hypothetical protein